MSRKSLGYVKLEWTCPNCNSRNPGPQKTCRNCGAPQPENVQFEMGANQELVKDENEIGQASAGADIHCGFCGARNPATATTCKQCGADLKEGKQRAAGRELGPRGANVPAQVTCPNCGQVNPGASVNCAKCGAALPRAASAATPAPAPGAAATPPRKPLNKWLIGGVIAFLLLACGVIGALFLLPTASVNATVQSVHWKTSVPVQEQQEVHYSDEAGSPPSDAYDVSCHTDNKEVCEEKTIDKGNGFAEVVQDCHTESQDYCSYNVLEWKTVRTEDLEGGDLSPQYAEPSVTGGQRLGDRGETFTVSFDTDKGAYTYTPNDLDEFVQYRVGTQWLLHTNAVGGIVSVEPAR
jgi:ribosomal protein L40E